MRVGRGWLSRSEAWPLIIGHRGDRARFPENTVLAFRKAFQAGADGIECDLQKTADDVYVVIHDADLGRGAGTPLSVGASRRDEIASVDVGLGQTVPDLRDTLDSVPAGGLLDLELKADTLGPEDCPRILAILRDHIDASCLMVSSFEPALLYPLRRQGVTVGLLLGSRAAEGGLSRLASLMAGLRPQYVNLPVQSLDVLGPKKAAMVFRALRFFGARLLFWTVNAADALGEVSAHARAIVTDDVAWAVASVREGV